MKKRTVLDISKIYNWIAIALMVLYIIDGVNLFESFGILIKYSIIQAYLYKRNNWRTFVGVLVTFTLIGSLVDFTAGSLFDIAGTIATLYYIYKYTK
ncbi:MAG: hypothetical protein U9O94_06450 [Nanoarchaeota archaeon]|nr:hypothetical protein [Nanoarchaeota archaeon]